MAFLDEEFDRVKAEAVYPHLLEPERRDLLGLLAHGAGLVVQVRHAAPEESVVVLVAHRRAVPVVPAPGVEHAGMPGRPAEPIAIRRLGIRQRRLEKWVFAGDVVQHQIDEHANATPVRLRHQALEVLVGAVVRIDPVVVRHIVPVIARRFGHGHEPDAPRAQIAVIARVAVVDIVEFLDEPAQISDAVAVAVVERADEDLIAHRPTFPVGGSGVVRALCGRGARTRHKGGYCGDALRQAVFVGRHL